MDFLSPIVGTVTGVEMAQWKDILIFTLKVFIFSLPFVVVGLLIERDILRVPLASKMVKTLLLLTFLTPVFLLGVLNFLAPGLPDAFWEQYPMLEGFWIMEGTWPPLILSGLVLLYFVSYVIETLRGDLSS